MENQLNIKINAILDDESSEEFKVQVRKIVQDIIKEEIEKSFKGISFPQYIPYPVYPSYPSYPVYPNQPITIYTTGDKIPNNGVTITCKG